MTDTFIKQQSFHELFSISLCVLHLAQCVIVFTCLYFFVCTVCFLMLQTVQRFVLFFFFLLHLGISQIQYQRKQKLSCSKTGKHAKKLTRNWKIGAVYAFLLLPILRFLQDLVFLIDIYQMMDLAWQLQLKGMYI